MFYEIKVLRCPTETLEDTLAQPAAQGWQLVSCWPEDGEVISVFQRATSNPPASPATSTQKSIKKAEKKEEDLLDRVIQLCDAQQPKTSKNGKKLPKGLAITALAKQLGMEARTLIEKLKALGIKEKADKKSQKDHCHNGTYIWINSGDPEKGPGFVNIRPAKKSS